MKQQVQMLVVANLVWLIKNNGAMFCKSLLALISWSQDGSTVPANIFVFQVQKQEGAAPVLVK